MKRKTILVLSSLMLLSSLTTIANNLPSPHYGMTVTDKIEGSVAEYVAPKKAEGVTEVVGSDYVSGVVTQVKEESDGTYSLRFVSLVKGDYNENDELELVGDYGFHLEFEGSQGTYNNDYDVTYLYNSISETVGEETKYYANEKSSYHGQEGVGSLSSLPVIGSDSYNLVMAVTVEGISADKLDTLFAVQSYVRVNDVKYYNNPSTKRVSVNNPSGTWNVVTDSNGGTDVPDSTYSSGTLTLTNPTRDNYVFTGWYYDKDCTKPVDLSSPVIAGDTTLYAGWRAPYAHIEETEVAGTYTVTKNTAALHGVTEADGYAVEMPLTFNKGASGAIGIAFRGTFVDYQIETGQKYLSAQIVPATGRVQLSRVDSSFAHLTGSVGALTTLPQSWQDKYNNAVDDEVISVTLKVISGSDSFSVYIDGELAVTSSSKDADIISSFTGKGYGLRSSTKGGDTTYSVNYSEENLVKVSMDYGDEVINRYTYSGGTIADLGLTYNQINGNVRTINAGTWYNGSVVATATDTYTEDTTLTLQDKGEVVVTRAGLVVSSDKNGDVYTDYSSDNYSKATLLPDVSMQAGSYSYDIEFTKQDGTTMNHRLLFLAKGNGTAIYNADQDEGSLFFNINFGTGTAVVGYKIHNISKNGNNASFKSSLKSCALKTKLYGTDTSDPDYVENGKRIKINIKVTFDTTGIKVYMDNFLVYVLGTISYDDETLYGKAYPTGSTTASGLTEADTSTYGSTVGEVCLNWLKSPEGHGVGFHATFTSMSSSNCGDVIISNIKCIPTSV